MQTHKKRQIDKKLKIVFNDGMENLGKLEIDIQYAEDDDFLWLKEHDKHISEEILKNKIKNSEIYVVKNNEKIIGWLRYNLFWDSIPFMNMIYILEKYWKMGIGRELVKY